MKLLAILLSLALLPTKPTPVSNPANDAVTPRFTTNAAGQPVLTWAEKAAENASFFFATSTDGGNTFGPKTNVPVPTNLATHAEGMPKLAFKTDGTLLALLEVPRPTADAPRAGDLLYITSANGGRTWTKPAAVHRDTTPGKGHSFSDMTRLPNGEIGIVWLDEKMPGREGRSVKFIQTLPQGGFADEVLVDDDACQCCRTNVFVDTKKQIHITYRDLLPAQAGEISPRDISHAVSANGGKSFSKPTVLLADGWRVNACPHTGPVVAQVGNDLYTTWFSGKPEAVGLRLARLGTSAPEANASGTLIDDHRSTRAKHPQVVTQNGQLQWLWDESFPVKSASDDALPRFSQRICLKPVGGATVNQVRYLTPADRTASYPTALATSAGLLVAWEDRAAPGEKAVIMTQLVN